MLDQRTTCTCRIVLFFATIIAIQKTAPIARGATGDERGTEPDYWTTHSVIVAQVVAVTDATSFMQTKIALQPRGTLSGMFDAGVQHEVEARTEMGNTTTTMIFRRPAPGTAVISVLCNNDDKNDRIPYLVLPGFVTYMPKPWASLVQIGALTDAKVDRTLASIRDVRKTSKEIPGAGRGMPADDNYWSKHSVVFGTIVRFSRNADGAAAATLDFRPIIKLSGELDPGLIRELDARLDLDPKQANAVRDSGRRGRRIPSAGQRLAA